MSMKKELSQVCLEFSVSRILNLSKYRFVTFSTEKLQRGECLYHLPVITWYLK